MLLLGLLALLMVDYIQLLIPQFYRLVINGVNLGQVVVNGQTLPFTKEVLLQYICPVSYTHLDVYKRQGSYCLASSFAMMALLDVRDGNKKSGRPMML